MQSVLLDIFINVVSNILSVIIPSSFIVIFIYLYERVWCRMMKDFRRFMYPENRVIRNDKVPEIFSLEDKTAFEQVYTEDEINKMVYASKGKNCFNGDCIRLDRVADNKAVCSVVGFYDFLTTNLTVKPMSKNTMSSLDLVRRLLFDVEFRKMQSLKNRVVCKVKSYGKLNTFSDVLSVSELANILTVSILIFDSTDRALLVKRGNKVVISSGNFAVSAAGSLGPEDFNSENPIVNCAEREIFEELNLDIDLHITDVLISRQKLQPAFLLEGRLDCTFEEILPDMISAKDFNQENTALFALPVKDALSVISNYQFTDVAAYQLFRQTKCSKLQWLSELFKKVDLNKYRLQ